MGKNATNYMQKFHAIAADPTLKFSKVCSNKNFFYSIANNTKNGNLFEWDLRRKTLFEDETKESNADSSEQSQSQSESESMTVSDPLDTSTSKSKTNLNSCPNMESFHSFSDKE